ncbi:ATP-grasp domain-containing protein [Halalkalicoccus tibetensis]|uniref:ATP-grasp domain-containing protein n=1 Tax=Halalkalicoccus tibetensis TaxID=175632 RepID=A0ABD5V2Q0_9EURY
MGDFNERVLLLDAHRNQSLYFARSLNKRGIGVTAGCRSRLAPGLLTKHTDEKYLYPDPNENAEQFVEHLIQFLQQRPHTAVIPMADRTHTILSKHKDRIAETNTLVGVEDWEKFAIGNNKIALVEIAQTCSVPVPNTHTPDSIEDIRQLKDEISYPVLLKPRVTTVQDANGRYREARIGEDNYVESPSELVATFNSFLEEGEYYQHDPPFIQEIIPGETVATGALAKNGEIRAAFQEKRLRTYPIEGGVGAVRTGIHEPEMFAYAQDIVAALDWTGPVYVEFMQTPDREFYLIEVNGRYWGSLGLAVNSGIDFPWYHYQQLRGDDFEKDYSYRIGVRQRRLFYTDIKWMLAKLSAGEIGAVPTFIRSFFDTTDDVLQLDDPLPAVGSVAWAGKRVLEKTAHSINDR